MTIKEPHKLGSEVARERVQNLLGNLRKQFSSQITDVKENWDGNQADFSFKMMGFAVSGKLSVTDTEAILESKLPLAARMMQSTIEKTIRDNARALLDA